MSDNVVYVTVHVCMESVCVCVYGLGGDECYPARLFLPASSHPFCSCRGARTCNKEYQDCVTHSMTLHLLDVGHILSYGMAIMKASFILHNQGNHKHWETFPIAQLHKTIRKMEPL